MIVRDTGPAKLPALPPVNGLDPALRNWMMAVTERLEVREGSRGNPYEKVVTLRDLKDITAGIIEITTIRPTDKDSPISHVVQLPGGLWAGINIDRFLEAIRNSPLYRDLMRRLDDPSRFNDIVKVVRDILLNDITNEAAKRGADIRSLEIKIQNQVESIAASIQEVTAALSNNLAGVRDTAFAAASATQVQAGKITQIQVSLGNYYQDGSPGRVSLEQTLTTHASYINGLRGQYTLKIQAGGALAGFGLAATEVNGVPSSAFLIVADKFAIVKPNYTGGMTNNPSALSPADGGIPFGVDSNGIYLNNNVYIRGVTIIDTPQGRIPLENGMRGSLQLVISGTSWSDISARQAVWQALGKSGSAPNNNHLVIGDTVTITSGGNPPSFIETRYWSGSAWVTPGAVINGNLLVNGSISAQKIDTRGLTIKDNNGNIIFGAGQNLSVNYISGLGSLATQNTVNTSQITGLGALATQNSVNVNQVNGLGTLATQNSVNVNQVTGLGALATQNSVSVNQVNGLGQLATRSDVLIGTHVKFPDGTTMSTSDFVNRLSKINSGNISTFIEAAAIGEAYIGNAAISNAKIQNLAVGTLKIQDYAVTIPLSASGVYNASVTVDLNVGAHFIVIGTFTQGEGKYAHQWRILVNGVAYIAEQPRDGTTGAMTALAYAGPGTHTITIDCIQKWGDGRCSITVLVVKK